MRTRRRCLVDAEGRRRGRGNSSFPSFRGVRQHPVESPMEGGVVRHNGRGRVAFSTVILAERGSPGQGLGGTLSLSRWNQPGDSRAERENDVQELKRRSRYPSATNRGIASSQSPRGFASALRRKLRPLPCSSFSDAIRFAGFASEAGVVAGAGSE